MKLALRTLLAAGLIVLAGSRDLAACPVRSTAYTFQVERPSGAPARGVRLAIEVAGSGEMVRATSIVLDTGNVLFCLPETAARPGDMADVYVPANLRVLYPPHQRLPLTSKGSPSIVVCEAGRDCSLRTETEVVGLLQKLQAQTRATTAEQKQATLHELQDWVRELSRETNANNEKLVTALYRKERQIKAASQASTLLRSFVNRARDVLDGFDRHAERVLDTRSQRELDEMSGYILAYNPIFNELREKADSYLKDTSDYWSAEVSSELRALIDEALEIHKQGIYPLNSTKLVIIDCIRKRPGPACPDREAARANVRAARKTAREVTLPRLEQFDKRATKWLDSLDDRLFESSK